MFRGVICFAAALVCLPAAASELQEAVAEDYDAHLGALFRHLHANPELSMQEFETAKRMAAGFEAAGYTVTGGTPEAGPASGDWAGDHTGLFRIEPEGSVTAGVEAMTLAALDLLGKP